MAEEVDREIGEVNGTAPDGEHHRLARVSMPHITNNLVLPAEQPSGRNIWPLLGRDLLLLNTHKV